MRLLLAVVVLAAGCQQTPWNDDAIYTLYRASVVEGMSRIHVATFDAHEKEDYNRENCQTAADLFQNQPGVAVKYWCEKGRYRE